MADSLGERSEGVIFDQILTRSCSISESHQLEVEAWLGRGMLVFTQCYWGESRNQFVAEARD